jgi:uncharacterized membrane protein YdjX (TVP38/TMEM64 family)
MNKYQRVFGVVIFLGLLFAVFELSGLRANFNLAFLQQQLDHHLLGGMMIFIVLFALGNLIQIPGWIFLAAAVLTLGRGYGGLLTYVAAILSCMLTFLMIRFIGGEVLRNVDNQWVARILSHLDEHPIRSVVLSRTLFQTAPPLNYALAISGIKFREYLLGTMLGLPLPIFIYCLFFDYLAQWMKLR